MTLNRHNDLAVGHGRRSKIRRGEPVFAIAGGCRRWFRQAVGRCATFVLPYVMLAVPWAFTAAAVAVSAATSSPASSRPATNVPQPALRAHVDPRVELMSIIFRLAGNPEYNMPVSQSTYAEDVEKRFGKFRQHAVVKKAQELRRTRGVSFDAVASMAVHLTDAVGLQEKIPFDQPPAELDRRWRAEEARAFVQLARQFVKDTDFASFLAEHRPLYTAAAIRMNEVLRRYDIRRWLDNYFGTRSNARYDVIVGLLIGGANYGVHVHFPDGREEISPVIGCASFDEHGIPVINDREWLPVIIHEFCHPYVNPTVRKNPEPFRKSAEELLARTRQRMRAQGYGNWETLVCESLVRASVVRYLQANHGDEVAGQELQHQQELGWKWLRGLCDTLQDYERHRDKYPALEQFMPVIVSYFDSYAARTR